MERPDGATLLQLGERVAKKFKFIPAPHTVADVAQDAVVRMLEIFDSHAEKAPDTPLHAWLVNRAYLDILTQFTRREDDPLPLAGDFIASKSPGDYPNDMAIDIRAAIDKLDSEDERAVMHLHLQGATQEGIAHAFGRGQSWACKVLARAKERLKTLLKDYA